MLKNKLLNTSLLSVLSRMGHTETLTIADCGLPVPKGCTCIDLAIKAGCPTFLSLLEITLQEAYFEAAFLAEELKESNFNLVKQIENLLKNHNAKIVITYVRHSQFKQLTGQSEAIVRTGEQTPYANIILQASAGF